MEELVDHEKELFKTWVENVEDRLHDDESPIAIDTSQPLMKCVYFTPPLVASTVMLGCGFC